MPVKTPPRETLNLRIKTDERNLIDRAARLSGKNLTDFILDAARREAEETILDRSLIRATPEAFKAFLDMLATSPQPNARIKQTMQTPAPWDRTRPATEARPPESTDNSEVLDMTRLPLDNRLAIAESFHAAHPGRPISAMLLDIFPELRHIKNRVR